MQIMCGVPEVLLHSVLLLFHGIFVDRLVLFVSPCDFLLLCDGLSFASPRSLSLMQISFFGQRVTPFQILMPSLMPLFSTVMCSCYPSNQCSLVQS